VPPCFGDWWWFGCRATSGCLDIKVAIAILIAEIQNLESENTERDALVINVDFLTSLVAAEFRQPLASRNDGSCSYACVEVEDRF